MHKDPPPSYPDDYPADPMAAGSEDLSNKHQHGFQFSEESIRKGWYRLLHALTL